MNNELRIQIELQLQADSIAATPQAITAIENAITYSPSMYSGDTDSLLVGLLLSGSYTVDAIESNGVNLDRLAVKAKNSLTSGVNVDDHRHSFETFFGGGMSAVMLDKAREKGSLDTADILLHAIAPVNLDLPGYGLYETTSSNVVEHAVRSIVLGSLTDYYEIISRARLLPDQEFSARTTALTIDERSKLQRRLGKIIEPVISKLMDQWFVYREVKPTPIEIEKLTQYNEAPLGYGANLFMSEGGDYAKLIDHLSRVEGIEPNRDASQIVLCERNGRIFINEYTYRNTLLVASSEVDGNPIQNVGVQSRRYLPLIPRSTISKFEELINKASVSEPEIQAFLEKFPEILMSFGSYSGVHPHVSLTEEGKRDKIPDFLLELPVDKRFDILDLKLPSAKISVRSRFSTISSQIKDAIAQLLSYRNYFDQSNNRNRFISKFGLEPFCPEIVVVIGRNTSFQSLTHRRELESQMNGAKLLTYDDLLRYACSRAMDNR